MPMNFFNDVIHAVKEAPQPSRCDAMIDGIVQTLETQSGKLTPQELSEELQAAKPHLVQAFYRRAA